MYVIVPGTGTSLAKGIDIVAMLKKVSMKYSIVPARGLAEGRICTSALCFILAVVSALGLQAAPTQAEPPNLARIAFWIPAERMGEFATAYEQQVVSLLERHGFSQSSEGGRATADTVFTRILEFASVPEFDAQRKSALKDSASVVVWRDLGRKFGTRLADDHIQVGLTLYEVPLGPGTRVPAGPGTSVSAQGAGHWRHFDGTDGPLGGEVAYVVEDLEGHIWFGSWGGVGVTRYDGRTFETFTTKDGLLNDRIGMIFPDRDGNVWIGSQDGVSRYDGETFTNYTTEDGLADNHSRPYLQDRQGNIWFGTFGMGATRFDGETFATFTAANGLASNSVRGIVEDADGNIWLGTRDGLSRFDGTSFTTFAAGTVCVPSLIDRNGDLWISTEPTEYFGEYGGRLTVYDGSSFRVPDTADGLVPEDAWALLEDQQGVLWFGSVKSGARWYDGQRFRTLSREDGPAGNSVWAISEDREGHLWFGHDSGVSRSDRRFTTFSKEYTLRNHGVSVFVDRDGIVWMAGKSGGLSRFDGEIITTFTSADGWGEDGVFTILQDRAGNLWFGTERGATRYDGKEFLTLTIKDGLAGVWVSMLEDGDGNLWFGTWSGDGISRYDGQTMTTFTPADGLGQGQSAQVASIMEDRKGHLWFGTRGGASRYDGESFRTGLVGPDAQGAVTWMVEEEEGVIWLGIHGFGVIRIDGDKTSTFSTDDGLADLSLRGGFLDAQGHLWIATNGGGVSRFDGRVFQTLTTKDGLGGNTVLMITQDQQGDMWFATNNGVTRFTPPPPYPPSVSVDAVVADRRHEEVAELRIPSTIGLTAFEFQGANMKTRLEAMVYRYRLKGHHDWRNTRDERVEYEDLPRGEYTFEVEAVDRDLVYSEEPATVKLTVHAPYERIGLLVALGLAVVLVAWQTARVVRRDRRLQNSNTDLYSANQAMSTANHELFRVNRELQDATQHKSDFLARMSHDLRTPMNAIIGYTRILLRRSKENLEERQYRNLENIQVSADHLLELINDILDLSKIEAGRMEVNRQVVELAALMNECASAVESLVRPGVELRRQVEEVEPVETDPELLRRVVNNLLGNAVKFTEQGSITVGLGVVDGQVELSVADTGVGIPEEEQAGIFDEFSQVSGSGEAAQGSGLGLAIAKKSVELLGGSIEVESKIGRGTTFTVRLNGGARSRYR